MTAADRRRIGTVVTSLVVAVGVVCALNGARRIGRPFPGFLVAKNRIVVSVGRPSWSVEGASRIFFAKVVGIAGRPITSADEIQARVATLPVGSPIQYRLRKQAQLFSSVVTVQRFEAADFAAVYGIYFVVGLCFAFAGCRALVLEGPAAAALPFFILCEAVAVALLTGGDVYGPYWFTPLYFTAHCLTPAAVLHFASSYPEVIAPRSRWRRLAVLLLYVTGALMAIALNLVAADPSLFLPLVYTVYLLLANALLLYLARLVLAAWGSDGPRRTAGLRHALGGFLLSATVPGVIFVIYPALKRPVSPTVLVAPLAIFPLWTLTALRRAATATTEATPTSVRLRLSLLFLGAVETAFLVGIAVFWLNNSWQQLVADVSLNQRQRELIDRLASAPDLANTAVLTAISASVQTVQEGSLVDAARAAIERRDSLTARARMARLADYYARAEHRLDIRRQWLTRLNVILVLGPVVLGVLQAVAFMLAVRRWLIHPIDQLAVATQVIATGDLAHRVQLDSGAEFARLADSINVMAAELARIQHRVDEARETRRRAAGAARDAERRRLARELHDSTLQDLSAVKFVLERALRDPRLDELQSAIDGIIGTIVGLRRVVDDLGAPELSRASLAEAITAYARGLTEGRDILLDIDLPLSADVPDWASRDVYRIAQEGITNAVRHAGPAHLRVGLVPAPDHTLLVIEDDGAGFDLKTVALGTGILGMRERAAAIGATLEIVSAKGRGTQVRLRLPSGQTRTS